MLIAYNAGYLLSVRALWIDHVYVGDNITPWYIPNNDMSLSLYKSLADTKCWSYLVSAHRDGDLKPSKLAEQRITVD